MLRQRGDTIVEVILGFVIFTLLILGSISIMNQGLAIAQRSVEQTQVRLTINGQTDLLRAAREQASTDPTIWNAIKSNALPSGTNPPQSSNLTAGCPATNAVTNGGLLQKSFIITSNAGALRYTPLTTTDFSPAQVASTITYTNNPASQVVAQGIWVQAVKVTSSNPSDPAAYDMYIRACWNSVGANIPITIATIVRLYDK